METIRIGATGGSKTVQALFLMLAIYIGEGDRSLAIDTPLELQGT